jgi:hypothetical protein
LSHGDSNINDDNIDQLLKQRLLDCRESLRHFKEDLSTAPLPRSCEAAANVVRHVVDELLEELETTADELIGLSTRQDKSRRSTTLHYSLESFLNFVDTVVLASRTLPSPFLQVMQMIEDDLPSDWRFNFVIWKCPELATLEMNGHLAMILEPFVNVCEILDDEPKCWIFFVPPSILDNPLNWPLVSHEVAHVLELTQIHAVQSVHGPRPETPDPYDTARMKYEHGEEYQADFVAAYFLGPCFVRRVISNSFSPEVRISASHPSWEERLKALIEDGLPKLPSPSAYEDLIKDSVKDVTMKGGIIKREAVNLPAILEKTVEIIHDKLPAFDSASLDFKEARMRLGQFLPYTGDYRCLLNAATLDEDAAMSAYSEKKLGSPGKEKSEYRYLIADCARLCYVRMHYGRRVESERISREVEREQVIPGQERGA